MMRRTSILGCALALAIPLTACDSDPDPMMDAGGGGTDSGMMMMGNLPDPVGTGEVGMALTPVNYACRGTATAPAGGADITFTANAIDFFSDEPVEGLVVDFFSDNTLADGCTGTCTQVTSDASGAVSLTGAAEGWYAYRINAGMATHMAVEEAYVTAIQYNAEAPADATGTDTLNAVRQSTINTLTSVLLISQQAGNSIVTGQAVDCDGAPVANARVRVFDSSGQIMFGRANTDPKAFYFNGMAFPMAGLTETNEDGLYGAGNIPVTGDGQIRVELWGVLEEGGEMEMLGCERVQAVADGITIINVGPTRSDGPSDCSG